MNSDFCECVTQWREEDGAWPKWIHIQSFSETGRVMLNCDVCDLARWVG